MEFNPLDPVFQADPYAYFKILRERRAIWVEPLEAFFVGRYDDVRSMVMEPETFSNRRFSEISKGEFDYAPGAAQLVATDPPEHTRLRELSSYAFRPAKVKAMEEALHAITATYLEPIAARGGEFDFFRDLASRIPIHAITRMLGVPAADGPTFRKWTADILSASNRARMNPAELAQIRSSVDAARAYFTAEITRRRTDRGEDMISAWVEAQNDGDRLTDEEILGLSILLLVGGDTTTAHLLGSTVAALLAHPEQLDAVRNDRSLMKNAIEETLRYQSPVQTVFLTTTRAVEFGDVHVPEGAAVVGVWSSANRDPEQFEDPDRFNIFRDTSGHQAFGFGPHFCLGAVLARAEARIVLNATLDAFPNLKKADDSPLEWQQSFWIRGLSSLRVVA